MKSIAGKGGVPRSCCARLNAAVEAGSRLVGEAGKTIQDTVLNAQKVSAFIKDIATAANVQSEGIDRVNTAVSQLDQMTQKNAALVEESAASAEGLKGQASQLVEVVRVFRLSKTAPVQLA